MGLSNKKVCGAPVRVPIPYLSSRSLLFVHISELVIGLDECDIPFIQCDVGSTLEDFPQGVSAREGAGEVGTGQMLRPGSGTYIFLPILRGNAILTVVR